MATKIAGMAVRPPFEIREFSAGSCNNPADFRLLWGMRHFFPTRAVVLLALLCAPLSANERTWTNVDGRTLRGVMTGKTSTTVTISVAGKEHQIPLDKLVEEDQKWIQENSVFSRARFKVRTLQSRGDSGDRGAYHVSDGCPQANSPRASMSIARARAS
jgi:hypothetical protein